MPINTGLYANTAGYTSYGPGVFLGTFGLVGKVGERGVSFVRPEVTNMLTRYEVIRDCLGGELQIKLAGEKYLPRPNAADTTTENLERYRAYLTRAVFYNVTARTHQGLLGQIFLREPSMKYDDRLMPVLEDADGLGLSITQLAKRAVQYLIAYGRAGIFVDYPNYQNMMPTGEEVRPEDMRPYMRVFAPWDIINWRMGHMGGKTILTMVVLRELYESYTSEFSLELRDRYYVLRLDEIGEFVVDVYDDKEERSKFQMVQSGKPLDSNGMPFYRVNFGFMGCDNNDPTVDLPPLYDLATLNIAHFRNSADYQESCFINGQATPAISGVDATWAAQILRGKINFGARNAIILPPGANVQLLQARPNSLPYESMRHLELQMIASGAKILEQTQVQRTATETRFDVNTENSTLASIANNASMAFKGALRMCQKFMGIPENSELEFSLNSDFELDSLSPEKMAQINLLVKDGVLSWEEGRELLRHAGLTSQTDKQARKSVMEWMTEMVDMERQRQPMPMNNETPEQEPMPEQEEEAA